MIAASDQINQQFSNFRGERNKILHDPKFKQLLKGLELKYKLNPQSLIQLKNNFVDAVDQMSGFTRHMHPTLDLAILKFNDYGKIHYTDYARFLKDPTDLKPGKFLCRLGFPFPEFSNYRFDEATDEMEWTTEGINVSPRFPLEGMLTRFLGDQQQCLYGIEMSTPGLRGQSGGPLFNDKGTVCGMQFNTKHLHLGFDLIDTDIIVNNVTKKVSDYSFIHLGQCIHVNAIKSFLQEKQVKFYEE
ncbi:MAG: hypothetical protein JWQ27_915 [Ferruginibacter sp.]|nr:hypothetical protein [Ferruginibacter sp.]